MRAVLKYEVPVDGRDHEVRMPREARIVHIDSHLLELVSLYAEAFDEKQRTTRTFRVFSTNEPIPFTVGKPYRHAGSFFCRHSYVVWHLYEKRGD
jgi:hypothetical protein